MLHGALLSPDAELSGRVLDAVLPCVEVRCEAHAWRVGERVAVGGRVERFDRRPIEPFELLHIRIP